jgi:DNA-binding protein H-NS
MEQSLLVLRNSWIKPFEEIIERQAGQLERLQEERRLEAIAAASAIAALEKRLKQIEKEKEAASIKRNNVTLDSQAAPTAGQELEIPVGSPQAAIAPKQAGISPRRRGWWHRFITGNR